MEKEQFIKIMELAQKGMYYPCQDCMYGITTNENGQIDYCQHHDQFIAVIAYCEDFMDTIEKQIMEKNW